LLGNNTNNPNYIYSLSNITSSIPGIIKANEPIIKYDKYDNNIQVKIPEFTSDITSSVMLKFKVYKIDETSIPDYTTIENLNIKDYIYIYGFDYASTYAIESYIIPYDTTINQSSECKFLFTTPNGYCSTPIVVRDNEYGYWTISCASNCRPSYTYTSPSYTNGNTMRNVNYQNGSSSSYGEPIENVIQNPRTDR
jgi:hypothetical protein